MTTFNELTKREVLEELNAAIPYEECDYMNGCIASMFAKGRQDRLNDDRIRRMLLGNVQDEFMTLDQALTVQKMYEDVIKRLKEEWK